MIASIKEFFSSEKHGLVEMLHTTKIQLAESITTTKVPVVIAGGTVATSFTSSEAAQWAAATLSIMLAGKVMVDIWARINEIMLKKRAFNAAEKQKRRDSDQ